MSVRQSGSDPDRARVREALADLIGERGYQNVSLAEVVERAGLEESDFLDLYEDLDACMLAIWQQVREEFIEFTLPTFFAAETWTEAMRSCAYRICSFM